MKPALLVIDIQKAFFKINTVTTESLNNAMEYINAAIAQFRRSGFPIIVVQHTDKNDNLVPGEEGFDLPEKLNILPEDIRIYKEYGNAFKKTNLHDELKKSDIDMLIVTGFCAEHCVLSTYKGAEDLDLTPVILRGSLASYKPENIAFVENISNIVSYAALVKFLS